MSAQHGSYSSFTPNSQSTPIVLLGFARSGTTTFQNHLAHSLEYNFAFEPIGFNHSHYPAPLFQDITRLFRNAPDVNDLKQYQISGGTLATLHLVKDEASGHYYQKILEDYLAHILACYGRNVVVKEVRLLFNVPTLLKIFDSMRVSALFVFLRANPLMTLYTYYRLGGLIESRDDFDLRVNEIYSYYQTINTSLTDTSELTLRCHNKWEKLLVSIALYQRAMEQLVSRYPENCLLAKFESIDDDLRSIMARVGSPFASAPKPLDRKPPRYTRDPFFLQCAREKLSPEVCEVAGISIPDYPEKTLRLKSRIQFMVTRQQNRVLGF